MSLNKEITHEEVSLFVEELKQKAIRNNISFGWEIEDPKDSYFYNLPVSKQITVFVKDLDGNKLEHFHSSRLLSHKDAYEMYMKIQDIMNDFIKMKKK